MDLDERGRARPWKGAHYLRQANPLAGQDQALNDTKRPIIDSIFTDDAGQGFLTLPQGSYILLDKDRVSNRRYRTLLREYAKGKTNYTPIDTACLRKWLSGPFDVLTITAGDTTHVTRSLTGKCSWNSVPCTRYSGPLPP